MRTRGTTGLWLVAMAIVAAAGDLPAQSPASAPAGGVTLLHRFPPGRRVVQQDLRIVQELAIGPSKLPTEVGQRLQWVVDASAPDAAGRQEIALRLRQASCEMAVDQRKLRFDSKGSPKDQDRNLAAAFGAMMSARITAVLDAEGRVQRLGGLDEAWRDLAAGAPTFGRDAAGARKSLADALTRDLSGDLGLLPSKAVAVGDAWNRPLDQELPLSRALGPDLGTVAIDLACRLESIEGGLGGETAVVVFGGGFERGEADKPTATAASTEAATAPAATSASKPASASSRPAAPVIRLRQEGRLRLNLRTGELVDRAVHQTMRIEIALPDPRGGPPVPETLTQELTSRTTLPADQP